MKVKFLTRCMVEVLVCDQTTRVHPAHLNDGSRDIKLTMFYILDSHETETV